MFKKTTDQQTEEKTLYSEAVKDYQEQIIQTLETL